MTAVDPAPGSAAKSPGNWLKIALVCSLALNLLFLGGGIARFFMHEPPERMSGVSQMQLIPRKFLGELDRPRRAELLKVFRSFSPAFKEGRNAVREEVINLASALEAEPYDAERVKAVVQEFSARSSGLAGQGGEAALTLIGMLTPEERKLLAKHIRLRGESGHHRGPPKSGGDD